MRLSASSRSPATGARGLSASATRRPLSSSSTSTGISLATASLYCDAGGELDRDTATRLAATADLVCRTWRLPDSGIWEVRSEPLHFTESKMMCSIALDRAVGLSERGLIPARHSARWRREAREIRRFIEERCWSQTLRSYTRAAGVEELDASLLLGTLMGYADGGDTRLAGTVQRVTETLSRGSFVLRYLGEDGLPGKEGAFLACSFWLVEALARQRRIEDACALMEQLLTLANDLGLYAEEIDARDARVPRKLPPGARSPRARECGDQHRGGAGVTIWGALAGGFVGTLVLTTGLRAATALRLTRTDLPFLLGTALTSDRVRARALGYLLHFLAGLVFSSIYFAVFLAIDESSWWLGRLFGLVHGAFAGSALVNILLPLVHPRMGSTASAAGLAPAARTARLPDAQLRGEHPGGHARRARRLRRDRRRLHSRLGVERHPLILGRAPAGA